MAQIIPFGAIPVTALIAEAQRELYQAALISTHAPICASQWI